MHVAIFLISSSSCEASSRASSLPSIPQFLSDGGMKEWQLFLLLLFSPSLLFCGPHERLLCGKVGVGAVLTSIQGLGGLVMRTD